MVIFVETHFSDQEVMNMQQMESTYAKHLRNQEMRTMSRERLNKRKNEREIVNSSLLYFFDYSYLSRAINL